MNLFKQFTYLLVCTIILIAGGLSISLNRLSLITASHQDVQKEWIELQNIIEFQSFLNELDNDLLKTEQPKNKWNDLFKEKIENVEMALNKIEICELGPHVEDDDHVQKENQKISEMKNGLKVFQNNFDALENSPHIAGRELLQGYVQQLIQLESTSHELQAIYVNGMQATMSVAEKAREQAIKQIIWIFSLIVLVAIFVFLGSVTFLKQSAKDIIQKEKAEVVGRLAKSFAHEIRNPLGIIKSSASIIKRDLKSQNEESELMGYLMEEVNRIDDLLSQFQNLGSTQKREISPENIAIIVNQCIVFLKGELEKAGVSISYQNKCENTVIRCNKNQIKQMVINLLLNAIQASSIGDEIEIVTELEFIDGKYHIRIQDHGKGMKKKEIKKLFDPFYTTKDFGTGLGLTVVKKIVDDHHGRIEVSSKVNEGTSFDVQLSLR